MMNFDAIVLMPILLACIYPASTTIVTVDTTKIIHVTDDHYTSFNLDSGFFNHADRWKTFNNTSERLGMLLACFSPSTLRIGGSGADWTVFDSNENIIKKAGLELPQPVEVMTVDDWVNFNWLVRGTGLRLLFDLNLQLRFGKQWDPTNAAALMDYSEEALLGESVDFELGNEPNEYPATASKGFTDVEPDQIASDYVLLRKLIEQYAMFRMETKIVGPDVVGTFKPDRREGQIIQSMANKAGKNVDAITFHHYYFRGDTATVDDYLNPDHFENLADTISDVKTLIKNSSNPDLPYWIGETADAWHSGTPNVSDRFVSGFLWLDKLGLSAAMGVGAVFRQTFFGGNYALVSTDQDGRYFPNPDYWVTLLFNRYVGHKVLNVSTSIDKPKTTRVYAHCTNLKFNALNGTSGHGPHPYPVGSVTVIALNMNKTTSDSLKLSSNLANQPVDAYLLTPGDQDGVLSKHVKVNGKIIEVMGDHTMPFALQPTKLNSKDGLDLPALSLAYFVFPKANIPLCT